MFAHSPTLLRQLTNLHAGDGRTDGAPNRHRPLEAVLLGATARVQLVHIP
jgi:hypothetical protein